jgi:hypothetical protein
MYFWLHSIPERIAHGAGKIQFQLVAVMSLLALFTHNNAFWVGALLLALIPIPDFWTPLAEMAESLAKMAGRRLRNLPGDDRTVATHEADAASTSPSPHAMAASLGLQQEAALEPPPQADQAVVPPAAPLDGDDRALPISGAETSAPAAKAAGGKRRALSREGA